MTNIFYFAVIVDNGTALTVIDLANCVDYEREEWYTADSNNFDSPLEAIQHTRALAQRDRLQYKRFVSRYNIDLNEI